MRSRPDREAESAGPYLSVVVPAFNEERRIDATLEDLVKYLDGQSYTWEVVVVDDGSTDATASIVRRQVEELQATVRLESIPHSGKGWAVRHGMLAASGQYRFMCDADLAMPIEHLGAFLDRMEEGYDVVVGSREIEGARRFDEPLGRHLRGRVFNWLVRLIAVGGFKDTQCGFKCFRGEVAQELFRLQTTRGWGFDVEILHLAVQRRLRVLEMPIDWYHREFSKIRPVANSASMLRDTLMVRLRRIQGKYGPADKSSDRGGD